MKKSTLALVLLAGLSTATFAQNKIDQQGRKQGHWLRTDRNGAKIYEGDFKDGLEVGTFNYYYPNGTLRIRNVFTKPGRYCSHEAFDEQGHLLARGYYNQKNRDSIWNYYNESGRLVKTAGYKMGIKQGAHIIYTSKGDTAEITHWNDNHREGRWWKRIGEKGYITGHFKNGGLEGVLTEYDDEGRLIRKGNYKNGLKNGSYQYFDNKTLIVDETWNAGAMSERKVLITHAKPEYISVANIAYVYPSRQKCILVRMDGSTVQIAESIETMTSRIGDADFSTIDKRNRILANTNCIRGFSHDEDGREIILLEPHASFNVYPDAEMKKLVQSVLRGDEME